MRTIFYNSVIEFRESFIFSDSTKLYINEDMRRGFGNSRKAKFYFVSEGLLHEFSSRLVTGTKLSVHSVKTDEETGKSWIEGDSELGKPESWRDVEDLERKVENTLLIWEEYEKIKIAIDKGNLPRTMKYIHIQSIS